MGCLHQLQVSITFVVIVNTVVVHANGCGDEIALRIRCAGRSIEKSLLIINQDRVSVSSKKEHFKSCL